MPAHANHRMIFDLFEAWVEPGGTSIAQLGFCRLHESRKFTLRDRADADREGLCDRHAVPRPLVVAVAFAHRRSHEERAGRHNDHFGTLVEVAKTYSGDVEGGGKLG